MAALCQPVCNYTNIVTTVWLVTSISLTQAGLHFQGGSPGPDPPGETQGAQPPCPPPQTIPLPAQYHKTSAEG